MRRKASLAAFSAPGERLMADSGWGAPSRVGQNERLTARERGFLHDGPERHRTPNQNRPAESRSSEHQED
jgi:hypothetical protein